jgi:hypothetical protein
MTLKNKGFDSVHLADTTSVLVDTVSLVGLGTIFAVCQDNFRTEVPMMAEVLRDYLANNNIPHFEDDPCVPFQNLEVDHIQMHVDLSYKAKVQGNSVVQARLLDMVIDRYSSKDTAGMALDKDGLYDKPSLCQGIHILLGEGHEL